MAYDSAYDEVYNGKKTSNFGIFDFVIIVGLIYFTISSAYMLSKSKAVRDLHKSTSKIEKPISTSTI